MTRPLRRVCLVLLGAVTAAACAQPPLRPTTPAPAVAVDQVEHSVIFIGDAGDPQEPIKPVLTALTTALGAGSPPTSVVFLGDNIYPRGMPAPDHPFRPEAERRLAAQVRAVRGAQHAYFLPGNHDWDRGGDDGWDAVRRAEAFVTTLEVPHAAVVPGGGCPGPFVVDPSPHLRIVIVDTQWLLHERARPLDPDSECGADSKGEVTDSLRQAVTVAQGRHVLVAGHHPLATGGIHGGHFTWKDHLFPLTAWQKWLWLPLPIIGSVYPLVRGSGISNQDIASSANREMRDSLAAGFAPAPPLAYFAGHEHTLQVLDGGPARFLVVSGTGYYGHASPVTRLMETRYASSKSGFIRVDVLADGRVRLGVLAVDAAGTATEDFSMWLHEGG